MKKYLRVSALVTLVAATGFWAALGANRGWTRTSVQKRILDEVTGIEAIVYEDRFLPGLDFLALAGLIAAALAGASFLFRSQRPEPTTSTQPETH